MKKQLLKSALIALAGIGLSTSAALSVTMDYFSGNASDASYNDNGAEYWYLTDLVAPASAPTIQVSSNIQSIYNHDYIIGMYSWNGSAITSKLDVIDTYFGDTSSNVIFDLIAGTATSNRGTAAMNTTFGFYIQFYTDIGSGIKSSEIYYSDDALGTGDVFSSYYDFNGLASAYYAETALGIGGPSTQGYAFVAVQDIAPVPEPTTMLLFGTGLLGLAAAARRRKNS